MKSEGIIVSKEYLLNLMEEYPDIDIAHYHEHGDFFYYNREDLQRRTDYYWVENKRSLHYESGIVSVTEIIPFDPDYEEKCADCGVIVPSGEIRYRIPYRRCPSCLHRAIEEQKGS